MVITETLADLGRRMVALLGGSAPKQDDASQVLQFINQAYLGTAEERVRIQKLRDFFNGDQVRGTGLNNGTYYIPTWPNESDDDKSTRADRMELLAWNRIRDGVMTHADALYAWGRGRAVHRRIQFDKEAEVSGADQKWLETYFNDRVWRVNGYAQWLWQLWTTVGAESQAVVMTRWMDGTKRRLKMFPSNVSLATMKEKGVVWYDVLDNLQVIPLPHPDQPRELGAVIRWYSDPQSANPLGIVSAPYPGQFDAITELVTDNLWLRWRGSSLIEHRWGTENRYGDVRTQFVWVRNPADIADSEDALPMQGMLIEDIDNGQELKRGHAFPETLYRGFEPPTVTIAGKKTLVRGPNVAYQSDDPDADIIKRGPPANVGDFGISQGDVHQALDEALGLSQAERDGGGLGQIRSAPGISKTQARSERRRRRKIMAAEKAEQDLFMAALDMTAFHAFAPEDRADLQACRLIVTFPEDAFTLEPYTEAQKDQVELQAGMVSREAMVRKRNPEFTEEQVADEVRRIEEQMEREAEAKKPDPGSSQKSLAQTESR